MARGGFREGAGRPPAAGKGEPNKVRLGLLVKEGAREKLKELAAAWGVSQNQVIERLIEEAQP